MEQVDFATPLNSRPEPQALAEVPRKPSLATDIQLIGELPASGFRDRQYLVRRGAHFFQVSELLYRIAEQANGERTVAEIAEAVTAATDWLVEEEDARQLMATKLIPAGVIAAPERPRDALQQDHGSKQVESSLAVRMRMKTLGPRMIDPITNVLQWLFALPILIPALALSGAAHWWLYKHHGISGGIQDALYTPGGLLIVLGLIIGAAFIHEFGHASALRYAGGRARSIGVGLYLIYPAFYTDVTDGYRLGRWARVRTDLGGVYFHAIFCLALIAIAIGTGKDLFLLAVLLINIDILRQFIPFVRLDGYWLLADLTGIPDFFSQMGPFIRSLLPAHVEGPRLPPLKPWVRAVFAVYIFATIPVLGYVFYLMLRGVPMLLVTSWGALQAQGRMFVEAAAKSDFVTAALLATTMLLLLLPIVGTALILQAVASVAFIAAWRWSQPSLRRRVSVATASAAVVVVLALWWAPAVRRMAASGAYNPANARARTLLQQSLKATKNLQSLQADLVGSLGPDPFRGTVALKRPNLARIEMSASDPGWGTLTPPTDSLEPILIVSDGHDLRTYFEREKQYSQSPPGQNGANITAYFAEQVDLFFRADAALPNRQGEPTYVGRQVVDGTEYDLVSTPLARNRVLSYYISPRDHLIHRVAVVAKDGGAAAPYRWVALTNIRTNAPIDDSAFKWQPPPGSESLRMPEGINLPPAGTTR